MGFYYIGMLGLAKIDIPADILTEVKESFSNCTPCYECWITDYGLFEQDNTGTWRVAEKFALAG